MNRIKQYRERLGVTQSDMAATLHISQGSIAHYENGRRSPGLDMCRAIVQFFCEQGVDCTLEDLFPAETEAA